MNSNEESKLNLIDYIEQTFNTVNGKIDGLLECSVKDFVLLNNNFQKQHSLLDSLATASNDFFGFGNSLLKKMEDSTSFKAISENTINVKTSLKEHLSELKGVREKYNYTVLIISNLKQDLRTLELLFTNLRFDPVVSIDGDKIQKCFGYLNHCLRLCDNYINEILTSLGTLIGFIEEGIFTGIENFLELSTGIESNLKLSLKTKSDLEKYSKQLEIIEKEKISSTSEIITNLQFQDILRQKIEHIISAHEHITKSLFQSDKKSDDLTTEQLVMVRDISSLQSAQLVHANKEYQSAVETILKRFAQLNKIQAKYTNIWKHFCKTEISRYATLVEALKEDLSLFITQHTSIEQLITRLNDLIATNNKNFKLFNEEIVPEKCNCTGILELEDTVNNTFSDTQEKEYSVSEQLKIELKKFQDGFSKFNTSLNELRNEGQIEGYQVELPSILKGYITNSNLIVSDTEQIIYELVNYKRIQAPELSKNPGTPGIEQVEYYKSFEVEVKEIITLHDALLKRINVKNVKVDSDSLGDLRDKYTMQSERTVHDKLISKKKNTNPDEQDDNEVEFF